MVYAEELVRKRIRDPGDFEWLKQCRFYWRDDKDTVIISICDREFEYSFEYLGVFTHKCCCDYPGNEVRLNMLCELHFRAG